MAARIFITTALCYLTTQLFAQKSVVDSLIQVINKTDSIEKLDVMYDLAYALRTSNPDSSLLIGQQMEKLAIEIDYSFGIANANAIQGIANTALGDYYYALRNFLDAQEIYQLLGESNSVAGNLNNIGRVYNFIEDYDQALAYYEESATRFAELKNQRQENHIFNNIGYIHKLRGSYEKSLNYLHRARSRSIKIKDDPFVIYPIYNIGSVYVRLNETDSALYYLNIADSLSQKYVNRYIKSLIYLDLGILYDKLNEKNLAINYLKNAFDVAEGIGLRSEQSEAAKHLSKVYEETNQLADALKYYKSYKSLNDSLINRDVTRRIAFQEAEYDFNQRQAINEIERKGKELIQDQALANAIWVRNSLIGVLIFVLIISYLLYKNFVRKRKANEKLRELNKKIELQALELLRANKEISVMNNNLEVTVNQRTKELKRRNQQLKEYLSTNSHIVRAPLARILGLVNLYDINEKENLEFINKSLHESAIELDNALRDINDNLSKEEN